MWTPLDCTLAKPSQCARPLALLAVHAEMQTPLSGALASAALGRAGASTPLRATSHSGAFARARKSMPTLATDTHAYALSGGNTERAAQHLPCAASLGCALMCQPTPFAKPPAIMRRNAAAAWQVAAIVCAAVQPHCHKRSEPLQAKLQIPSRCTCYRASALLTSANAQAAPCCRALRGTAQRLWRSTLQLQSVPQTLKKEHVARALARLIAASRLQALGCMCLLLYCTL